MSAALQKPSETDETPLYGDAEITAASGLALPSLRVLQAAGAIRAEKEAKDHGGFRRMWQQNAVLKASIGALMNEHFAWNIRTVAEALAKTHAGTWEALIAAEAAIASELKREQRIVKASDQDWFLELVDRKFVFLRVPELMTAILPDVVWGQTDLLLGMIEPSGAFRLIPWLLGNKSGTAKLEKIINRKTPENVKRIYALAMAAHANCLSKTSLNVSLQVRAAWRRLNGLEAYFVEAVLQPKEGEIKNASKSTSGRASAASKKGGSTGNNR